MSLPKLPEHLHVLPWRSDIASLLDLIENDKPDVAEKVAAATKNI